MRTSLHFNKQFLKIVSVQGINLFWWYLRQRWPSEEDIFVQMDAYWHLKSWWWYLWSSSNTESILSSILGSTCENVDENWRNILPRNHFKPGTFYSSFVLSLLVYLLHGVYVLCHIYLSLCYQRAPGINTVGTIKLEKFQTGSLFLYKMSCI